jgi:aconitate hydratase
LNLAYKIIKEHLIEGNLEEDNQIMIKVDQTLGNDLTGIMAGQLLESVEADKIWTELSVIYSDHNTLAISPDNSNDHLYLKLISQKYGIYYSKPGNGICHTLHYQRFARPGKVLLGADSHTPTSGALAMLAIGSGGLTVAKSIVGEGYRMHKPKVLNVKLKGKLKAGVSAKDISLEVLRLLSVKGGVGYIIEYTGEGIKNLSVPERATITNMSTELGALTGIFPSDKVTRDFLKAQNREDEWVELLPDENCYYDKILEIDLKDLEPLVARPHMPDLVKKVGKLEDIEVSSVFIGSCTNSSYADIAKAAKILKNNKVHKDVDLTIAPGSRQILQQLSKDGVLDILIESGARILECACGPCIGIGQVPHNKGVSLRTSNRNFIGRSGNNNAYIYLCGPEVAAASAIKGIIVHPSEVVDCIELKDCIEPNQYVVDDWQIIPPFEVEKRKVEIIKGENISEIPLKGKLKNSLDAKVVIKLENNITTDDIMPSSSDIMSHISNIPKLAEYTFCFRDKDFVERAKELKKTIIIAGENYGQGSSREHAALLPMFLGIEAVIAKSYARIHKENLINYGLLPLLFTEDDDYERIRYLDQLVIENLHEQIKSGRVVVKNTTQNYQFETMIEISDYDRNIMESGGILNYLKESIKNRK